MELTRRAFVGLAAAGASHLALVSWSDAPHHRSQHGTPKDPQGQSQAALFPRLGVDCFTVAHRSEQQAQAIVEHALAAGLTFFASATNYLDGKADRRLGTLLPPTVRDQLHVQTRSSSRDKLAASADLELAMVRHGVDYFDSFMINSTVRNLRDDQIDAPAEDTFEALIAAKQAGQVGLIGLRESGSTEIMAGWLNHYQHQIDFISLPIDCPMDDPAVRSAQGLGIPVIGESLRPKQQAKLLKSVDSATWLPECFACRLLRFDKAEDVARYAQQAVQVKAGLL